MKKLLFLLIFLALPVWIQINETDNQSCNKILSVCDLCIDLTMASATEDSFGLWTTTELSWTPDSIYVDAMKFTSPATAGTLLAVLLKIKDDSPIGDFKAAIYKDSSGYVKEKVAVIDVGQELIGSSWNEVDFSDSNALIEASTAYWLCFRLHNLNTDIWYHSNQPAAEHKWKVWDYSVPWPAKFDNAAWSSNTNKYMMYARYQYGAPPEGAVNPRRNKILKTVF